MQIRVDLPQNAYDIAIAPGSLETIGEQLQPLNLGKKVLLVSNPSIFKHYGEKVQKSLESGGFAVSVHLIPPGERYKTLKSIQKVYDTAFRDRLERSSTFIALGGGVIGDMTGFAASSWLRGVNFVQMPTSLLAMVDAAIGGKTGVNHPEGKNLIGAFYQPKLVAIDPLVLKTLHPREFRAGMAEVIKYGIIWDADLFDRLEAADRLTSYHFIDKELLQVIVRRSCQAKAEVVSKDEKEAGLRAILNYGHTIGHAVESLTGYRSINHGEAVGIGMVAAGEVARQLGMWDDRSTDRQNALIEKTGLPTKIPATLKIEEILETLKSDKKVKDGKVRFILPDRIGSVSISDRVGEEEIAKAIAHCWE